MPDESERSLLFGLLALREKLIDRETLNDALRTWAAERTRGLDQILNESGVLTPEQSEVIQKKVVQQFGRFQVITGNASTFEAPGEAPRPLTLTEFGEEPATRENGEVTVAESPRKDAPSEATVVFVDEATAKTWTSVGTSSEMRYEILRLLAKGGLGEVHVARDKELNRDVALKMIQERCGHDESSRARFLFEAGITSALEHPGIVPVHGHGLLPDGRPYYTMRLIDGEPFKDAIQKFHESIRSDPNPQTRSLGLRQLLRRFLDVCNVIDYAHSRNVLHRDLKPSNIMLGPYGETLVVDWGLAKTMEPGRPDTTAASAALVGSSSDAAPNLSAVLRMQSHDHPTIPGTALGTPHFMSPEQSVSQSDQTGRSTDIYGLGATLYYVLTCMPPCDGTDISTILKKVRAGEITPPRQVRAWVPEALDAICMKAIALRPADRYDSARALAVDIEHWLADEPVSIHLDPFSIRLTRWGRRHRMFAVAFGMLLLSAVIGLTLGTVLLSQANRLTEAHRILAVNAARTLEWQGYVNRVNLAQRECMENNIAQAEKLLELCPVASRGWEWSYVARLCHQERYTFRNHTECVNAVAFSPDGKRLVSGSGKPFNLPRGNQPAELLIWEAETGQVVRRLEGLKGAVHSVAYSHDGKWIASGSGSYQEKASMGEGWLTVWNAETGAVVFSHRESIINALSVAFSPDDRLVAAGFGEYSGNDNHGRVMIFEIRGGKIVFNEERRGGGVHALDFHPDGRRIAVAGKGVVELWDIVKNENLYDLALEDHESWVYSLAFSRDGRKLAAGCGDRSIRIWDLSTRTELKRIEAHMGMVLAVAFSPDGTKLASSGDDSALKLWDLATGWELTTLHGHTSLTSGLPGIAFSPDGARLASAAGDRTVKLWDVTTDRQVTFHDQKGWITSLLCMPDQTTVVSGSADHSIAQWEAATGRLLRKLKGHDDWVLCLAVSPDGTLLASGGADPTIRLWNRSTGAPLPPLKGHNVFIRGLAFSPDGKTLVSAGSNEINPPLGEVFLWDVERGERQRILIKENVLVNGVAFSADGQSLALVIKGREGPKAVPSKVIVYDWPTLRERFTLVDPSGFKADEAVKTGGTILTFSPVGQRLATDGPGGTVRIYDISDGHLERTIQAHNDEVASLAFSPDGKRLASSGYDKLIRIWDLVTGDEVLSLRGHEGGVVSLAFSPDGYRLFSGGIEGTAKVWDARPLMQPVNP